MTFCFSKLFSNLKLVIRLTFLCNCPYSGVQRRVSELAVTVTLTLTHIDTHILCAAWQVSHVCGKCSSSVSDAVWQHLSEGGGRERERQGGSEGASKSVHGTWLISHKQVMCSVTFFVALVFVVVIVAGMLHVVSAKLNQIVANNLNRFECWKWRTSRTVVAVAGAATSWYIRSWGQISLLKSSQAAADSCQSFSSPRGGIKSAVASSFLWHFQEDNDDEDNCVSMSEAHGSSRLHFLCCQAEVWTTLYPVN